MEDWQGGESSKRKRDKKQPSLETKASPITPRKNETEEDGWQRGKKNRSTGGNGNLRNRERWNWVPEKVVNWIKAGYYTKLWTLILLVVALVVVFIQFISQHSTITQVVVLQPPSSSKHWMGGSQFLDPSIKELLQANKDLTVVDPIGLASKIPELVLSGPDKNLQVFYLRATGFTFANGSDLEAYLLDQNANPFDYLLEPFDQDHNNSNIRGLVRLEEVLDGIAEAKAADGKNPQTLVEIPHKLVILDIQSIESPTNPSTFVDWFPKAVKVLYEEKKVKYSGLTLVVSHQLGEKNWPMPENGSTVFGHFARMALLGAADGAIDEKQNRRVSLDEFEQFVRERANQYVSHYRDSTQRPFVLSNDQSKEGKELEITVCPTLKKLKNNLGDDSKNDNFYSSICDALGLDDKWEDYEKNKTLLNDYPYLDARAVAVLARMEQLCLNGVDRDNPELKALDKEWNDIFANLPARLVFEDAISLQEIAAFQEKQWPSELDRKELDRLFLLADELNALSTLSEERTVSTEPPEKSTEPLEKPADPNEDPGKNGNAADPEGSQPPAEDDDTKKNKEEFDQLAKKFAKGRNQNLIVWKLWHECQRRVSAKPPMPIERQFLLSWLERVNDKKAKELMEAKYLQLLADNVDWQDPDPENQNKIQRCIQLSIKCRDLSEEILVNECKDSKALPWISVDLENVTNQVRVGEDYLFATEYKDAEGLLGKAEAQLRKESPAVEDSIRWRAETIRDAIKFRDDVFRAAPHLAVLIARQKLRPMTKSDYLNYLNKDRELLDLLKTAHQLGDELSNVGKPDFKKIRELAHLDDLTQFKADIANHCDQLLKQEPTTLLVFAPQLISSPLVASGQRKELRRRYNDSLNILTKRNASGQIGEELSQENGHQDSDDLLKRIEDFRGFMKAAQNAARPKAGEGESPLTETWISPYVEYGNRSRFSKAELTRLWNKLSGTTSQQSTDESVDKLKDHLKVLRRHEHWIRAGAAILAENAAFEKEMEDPYIQIVTSLNELHVSRRLNYELARLDKTISDFWGDNWEGNVVRIQDRTAYYERIVNRVENRLPRIKTKALRDIKEKIVGQVDQDLDALRDGFGKEKFGVASPEFKYFPDDAAKPHSINVAAGTGWQGLRRKQSTNSSMGPVVAVQLQKVLDQKLADPFPVRLASDATTEMKRRFKVPVGATRQDITVELSPKEMKLPPRLKPIQAFRGHLATTETFELTKIDRPPDDETTPTYVNLAPYQPDENKDPKITVRGGKKAIVDIMFVFDCSGSMEGEKFTEIRKALENVLQNIDPSSFRIGLVAIGNRVYFKVRNGLTKEIDIAPNLSEAQKAEIRNGLRPFQDAEVIHDLQLLVDKVSDLLGKLENLKAHGCTPLYLGMNKAAEELMSERGRATQKLVIAITDGVESTYEVSSEGKWEANYGSATYLNKLKVWKQRGIQYHFIGYGIDQGQKGVKELKSLCGNENFIDVKKNVGEIEIRLNEITAKPKFVVYNDQSKPKSDPELLEMANENDEPWGFEEPFQPGYWTVRPVHAQRTFDKDGMGVYLYGGENLQFTFDGRSIRLDKDTKKFNQLRRVNSKRVNQTRPYDVYLDKLETEKTRNIPVHFLFDDPNSKTTIIRPDRICLEVSKQLTDDGETAVTYVLQDVNYDRQQSSGFPCATFHVPKLEKGDWEFRLGYQPMPIKPSWIKLTGNKSLEPGDFGKFNLDLDLQTNVFGDSDERTVTVKLTLPEDDFEDLDPEELRERINQLRSLIVDVSVRKNNNFIQDFEVQRSFSTELLETPVKLDPASMKGLSLKATHTFTLGDNYQKDVYLAVRNMEDAFAKIDIRFVEKVH